MTTTNAKLADDVGELQELVRSLAAHVAILAEHLDALAASLPVEDSVTPPPEPDDDPLPWKYTNVDKMRDWDAGAQTEVRCIAGVVLLKQAPEGKHLKFAGAGSTQATQGAYGLGVRPDGSADFWWAHNTDWRPLPLWTAPQPWPPPDRYHLIKIGKRTFVALQTSDMAVDGAVNSEIASLTYTTPLAPPDREAYVLAGYWNGKSPVDSAEGKAEWIELVYYGETQDLPALFAAYKARGLIDEPDEPEPPIPPPPQPGDDYHVRPDMSAAEVGAVIRARGQGATVAFAPGTYRGLDTLLPLDSQVFWFGDGRDPSKCVLDGSKRVLPAISSAAKNIVLRGGTIMGYAGQGSPGHLDPLPGGTAKFGAIDGQAAVRPQNNMGRGPAEGWVLNYMRLTANYCEGVNWCKNMVVVDSELDNNGSCGGGGFDGGVMILRTKVHDNGRWHYNVHDHNGGIKFQAGYASQHPPFQDHKITECLLWANYGRAIWADYNGLSMEVSRCSMWQNHFAGIEFEVWANGDLHHCLIGDNLRSASTGLHIQEVMLKNSKMCRVRRNLIVVNRLHPLWLCQHNRSNQTYPVGDRHIGFSSSNDNVIEENVFLFMAAGARFDLQHTMPTIGSTDPACSGSLYPAGGPLAGGLGGNNFCFVPRPGGTNPLRTVSRRNTYRSKAGVSVPARPWPDSDAHVLGNAELYYPKRWDEVPTWDLPPGFAT